MAGGMPRTVNLRVTTISNLEYGWVAKRPNALACKARNYVMYPPVVRIHPQPPVLMLRDVRKHGSSGVATQRARAWCTINP